MKNNNLEIELYKKMNQSKKLFSIQPKKEGFV